MSASTHIIILACLLSCLCAIPGVFLLLRRLSMLSDAISHSILLGIVGLFFIIKNLHSPLFIFSAAMMGLLAVLFIEALIKSKRVKKDSAIGLVFPFFFALAIVLINIFASKIHLDIDAVLMGEIAFAPFNRFIFMNMDLGPIATWSVAILLGLTLILTILFYKELVLSTFDSRLAYILGFSPVWIHYVFMSMVSLTTVVAFDAVGAILVLTLMIAPASTAYLLVRSFPKLLIASLIFACIASLSGYSLAAFLDVSIAGSIASMSGFLFLLAFLFSPQNGLIKTLIKQRSLKIRYAARLLTIQLLHHLNEKNTPLEHSIQHLTLHMGFSQSFSKKVLLYALEQHWVVCDDNHLTLTALGKESAIMSMKAHQPF